MIIKHGRKYIAAFLIVFSILGVGFYLYSKNLISNKTISLAINYPLKTFDPVHVFDEDGLSVIGQSLDTLYQYHYLKRPYEVVPSLAESMPTLTDEGRTYLIKIKPDIYYHDPKGILPTARKVKAHDFVLQIKRLAFNPLKSVGRWLFAGKILGFDDFSNKVKDDFDLLLKLPMEGVTALDDLTLEIKLKNPEPNLLYFLSMTFTAPVPEELILKYNNDLGKVMLGTGAYYLDEIAPDRYSFKNNKQFRRELYPSAGDRYANTQKLLTSSKEILPFLDEITFYVIEDEQVRWNAFMSGKLDVLSVPKSYLNEVSSNTEKFEILKKKLDFEVKYFTTISSRWLGFNMQDPVLGKNLHLRKAIAYAIDNEKYIELLTNNTSLKANSIYNPSIPGYEPIHNRPYNFNLEIAKKHLEQSRINLDEFILTYSTRGKQPIHFEEAEFIKNQLAQIGLKVKIEVLEFSDFIKKGRAGQMQFFTDQWIYDYPDAENILQLLISQNYPGINKSGYINKKVDDLYKRLAVTLNKADRFVLMGDIEKIVEADLPWVMLMYESTYVIYSKRIQNFRKSFFIRNFLKYVKKN
jgi:oligopeptide transport system substrate-binding protein